MAGSGDRRDRVRFNLTGGRLDEATRARLAEHFDCWRPRLPGYDLRVPPPSIPVVGVIAWGELVLDEPAPPGEADNRVATLLDALAELEGLVAGSEVVALAGAVAYRSGPLGFEAEPRAAAHRLAYDEPPAEWRAPRVDGERAGEVGRATPIPGAPDPAGGSALFTVSGLLDSLPIRDRVELAAENDVFAAGVGFAMALVAGFRDRPRSEEMEEVYGSALAALALASHSESAPTLALVLSRQIPDLDDAGVEGVCRALNRNEATRPLLGALADAPGFAVAVARTAHDDGWYRHPFWKVRVAAIMGARRIRERARIACSVWATIDASGLPVDERPFSYLTELAIPDGDRDWEALAAPFGGLEPLPPLPTLTQGATSSCADLRAWCRAALGEPAAAAEAPPAVLVIDGATRAELLRVERDALDEVRRQIEELPGALAGYEALLDELPDQEPPT